MPTAAKLVAAIAFAAMAFYAAETFKPAMPPDTSFGYFSDVCAGIGLLCGWFVMGDLVGRGYRAALGSGLRTSVTIAAFALLAFSGREMILRALTRRYHGPVDALQGMFALIVEYGQLMLRAEELAVLLVGGALAGMLAEWAGRRWS